MTTPAQSQARMFNPNAFKSPDDQVDQSQAQQSQNQSKEYPVTGNSSRDSVRKMLYELYQGDQDLDDECKDPKSKQYRDKTRAVQIKLKGPRFEQSRNDLRQGAVDAKTLIKDDYVQGKNYEPNSQSYQQQNITNQNPQARIMPPAGGAPGFRPPGPGGAIGGIRPRFMPPGGMGFRPPMGNIGSGTRPPVPQPNHNQPPQIQQINSQINSRINTEEDDISQQSQRPDEVRSNHQSLTNVELERPPIQDDTNNYKLNGQREQSQLESQLSLQEGDVNQRDISDSNNSSLEKSLVNVNQLNKNSPNQENRESKKHEQSIIAQNDKQTKIFKTNQSQSSSKSLQFNDQQNSQLNPSQQQFSGNQLDSRNYNQNNDPSYDQQQQLDGSSLSNMVDISQDKAIGIDDSIASNEAKKPSKKKKKTKKKVKKSLEDENKLDETMQIHEQELDKQLIESSIKSKQEEVHSNPIHQNFETNHNQIVSEQQIVRAKYDFLDQSSSVIIQDKDESFIEQKDKQLKNQTEERADQLFPPQFQANLEEQSQEIQNQQTNQQRFFEMNDDQSSNEEERKTETKHKSNQHSIENHQNLLGKDLSLSNNDQKLSKNQSVKSLAGKSASTNHNASHQLQANNLLQINQNISSAADQENLKRLQDALAYKKQQKKELNEKLVHLENDIHLQKRKETMLLEENKQMNEDLRNRNKELKALQSNQNESMNQLQIQFKRLEGQVREKNSEIDQLRREVQRQREEKQQYKERVQIIQEENVLQRQNLESLLGSLESRVNNSSAVSSSNQIQQIPASSVMSVPQSNQSEQVELLQRELREMKNQYELKIRELNEDLNNRTRMLQRSERQNIQLQEKNNQLQELLSQVELQQLSTVAGSGSNQRDSTSLLNRRQGGGSAQEDNQQNHRAFEEEEGTGGDVGYNQSSQSNVRNQNEYLYQEEGGNGAAISGMSENFDEDSNQNAYQDGGSTQRNQRNNQNYQNEAVSGGHPQFGDDVEQEEGDELEDEDYEEDEGDMAINDEEEEDEEGNQFDDNLTQGIASSGLQRDNQTVNNGAANYGMPSYQGDINDGYAGGQQTHPQRQSKQGQRRRGNRQQNQQHVTTTTGQSSISIQNPRQRNSRGRQQRSNQQQIQQQQQIQSNSQAFLHNDVHPSHAPSSAPSSQLRQNAQQQQQQQTNNEYFQNYGDSSSIFLNSQNNRDQSSSAILPPQNQFTPAPREGAAGSVVLTAGRQNAVDSMMSAESGSTATAYLDKNQFHRGHNLAQTRQQTQPSSLQSVQLNQLQFQTGSNNQASYQQQQQTNIQQVPSDLFGDNDTYTAAVGAPTSRAAAQSRQASRQQPSNQSLQNPSSTSNYGNYQFVEEVKQSSGEVPIYYQNQNANQQFGSSINTTSGHFNSNNPQQMRPAQVPHNQYVGGSGEQEEDSSQGYFPGSRQNTAQQNNQILQHNYHLSAGGGPGSAFESSRRNQGVIMQQQHQIRTGIISQQQQHSLHQDQSNTLSRNDSRKTSGANTPNKDGADTPTTKAYRGQQQQNSYVHNLTSNQLFFSSKIEYAFNLNLILDQEDGETSSLFGGNNLSQTPIQNQLHLHHHPQQQQQQQQQYGRDIDVINPSLFE